MEIFVKPEKTIKRVLIMLGWFIAIAWVVVFEVSLFREYTDTKNGRLNGGVDFTTYYSAAKIVKEKPTLLYDLNIQREFRKNFTIDTSGSVLHFLNTPLVALINIPYTLFSVVTAYKINYLIQTVVTALLVIFLGKYFNLKRWVIPLFLTFIPVVYQAFYGQISIVIAITIISVFILLKRKNYGWAGAVSSLLLFKFQHLLLVPYLLIFVPDRKKYISGFISSSVLLVLIDSIIYRSFFLPDYFRFLFGYGSNPDTFALFNITEFLRYFNVPNNIGFLVSVVLFFISLTFLFFYKRNASLEKIFVSAVLLDLSINFHTTVVDLIFLLVPISLLIKKWTGESLIMAAVLFIVPIGSTLHIQGLGGLIMLLLGLINLFPDNLHLPLVLKNIAIFDKSKHHYQ